MDRSRETDLAAGADGLLGDDDALGRSLARWAAEAVVDEAARARVRARWLVVQAEEDASLAGTLLDLAEHRRPVVLDVAGQRYRGVLVGIGGDFVALRSDQGQQLLVVVDAIEAIRAEPGGVDVRGERSPALELTLAAVLGPVAADRPDVVIRTRTGTLTRGVLRSAGTDVVRLRVDGDPPTPVWIPLAAIAVLVVEP